MCKDHELTSEFIEINSNSVRNLDALLNMNNELIESLINIATYVEIHSSDSYYLIIIKITKNILLIYN
jgi:hypothetical protein